MVSYLKSKNPMKELKNKKSSAPIPAGNKRPGAPAGNRKNMLRENERTVSAPAARAAAQKRKKPSLFRRVVRIASIVVRSIFEEIGIFLKKIPKVAYAAAGCLAAAALIICAVVYLVSLSPEENQAESIIVADATIGESEQFISESERTLLASEHREAKLAELNKEAEKSFSVTFDFYSKEDVVCLSGETSIGELMDKLGITLSETDVMRSAREDVISSDTTVSIDEIVYKTEYKETAIPFETTYQDVQNIPRGTTKTQRSGVNGVKTAQYSVTYVNGVETERTFVSEKVTKSPTNAIINRGVGGTVVIGGVTYTYSYYMDCRSTCYTGGGITATGLPADEKVIAVDPTVIPYYTNVYIPGIGIRIAADCGGGIKGNIIDIYFDEDNPLLLAGYGWKNVRIYILD